jgi:hypothetical protein
MIKNSKSFPFEKARRVSADEIESARKAIEIKTTKKRALRNQRPAQATSPFMIPNQQQM